MISKRSYMMVLATLVFLFSSPAMGANREVVVVLKDGSTIKGVLLQLSASAIQIDPEGPVSLRTIPADEISTVFVPDMKATYAFPLSDGDVPSELLSKRPGQRIGFPAFALELGGGIVTPGALGDTDYYEGFGPGPEFQASLRYHFHQDNPRRGRSFISLSYRFASLRSDEENIIFGFDADYNPYYLVLKPLHMHNIGLEFGRTSNCSASNSYVYGLMGIALIVNNSSGDVHAVIAGTPTSFGSVAASDNELALRMSLGAVIGLGNGFGLSLKGTGDVLVGRTTSYLGQESLATRGALWAASAGLCIEL